jgi:hypothetical protein
VLTSGSRSHETRFIIEVTSWRKSVIGTMFDIHIIDDISCTAANDGNKNDSQQDETPAQIASCRLGCSD